MLSAIHADKPESNEKLQHYLEAKKNADEYLKSSGLNYAIVRPGTLTNDAGTGKIELDIRLDHIGEISRDDVAKTIVTALNDEVAQNATFEILKGDTHIEEAVKKVA